MDWVASFVVRRPSHPLREESPERRWSTEDARGVRAPLLPTVRPSPPPVKLRPREDVVALAPPEAGRVGLPHVPRQQEADGLPFRRADGLLTEGELAFWHPLSRAVKGKFHIFCKVRLADVVRCPDDLPQEGLWFRRIGWYHVDFVLCEPRTTRPVLVIELDDRRHGEGRRKDRDAYKDEVLSAAGMPVYRVRARGAYDLAELAREIERRLG